MREKTISGTLQRRITPRTLLLVAALLRHVCRAKMKYWLPIIGIFEEGVSARVLRVNSER